MITNEEYSDEFTYFIKCNEFVKIGKSTDHLVRFDTIQSHNPYRLTLLGITQTPERTIHEKFSYLRGRGEWFFLTSELKDYISKYVKCELSDGQFETFKEREEKIKSIRQLIHRLEKEHQHVGYHEFWGAIKKLGYKDEAVVQEIVEQLQDEGTL